MDRDASLSETFPVSRKRSTSSYAYRSSGWRSFRALPPGRGMYHDVHRRLPYYWSDVTDALYLPDHCHLLPAIASILDMIRRTGNFYGLNESLFSSALAAMVFSIFAAQLLTIVGVTGLISLFNYTVYGILAQHEPALYANFMCWTAIWGAIFHWIVARFAMYVGIIYCTKGVEELANEFALYGPAAGFLSSLIAVLYFLTVYGLEWLGSSTVGKPRFRGLLADYAYVQIGTLLWTCFAHLPGPLKKAGISMVPISKAFCPTQPRGWLIHFWELEVKWVFAALPFGFLIMLLFYYDHNVSSLTAQARHFPMKKPAGCHWGFFCLLECTTIIAGITGVPLPNGLVPQAPAHTDSLTIYKTDLAILTNSSFSSDNLTDELEVRHELTKATSVIEQRASRFLMGLAIGGTMTGPLLIVLHTIPAAVFAGVFFIVGWGSIESNGMMKKIIFLLREKRFVPRHEKLLRVKRRSIILYLACEIVPVAACVAISQTIAAVGFPVLIIAMTPFRVWILLKWFTVDELRILDDLTASNSAVLGSLGGKPQLVENRDAEEEEPTPDPRQRMGRIER
ncbi:hypothetical protein BDW66DRAFT_157344 [Aspergillus desertorum]